MCDYRSIRMYKSILFIAFSLLFFGLKSSELKTIQITLDYVQLNENSTGIFESWTVTPIEAFVGVKSMPQMIFQNGKFKVEMSVKAVYKPKLKVNVGKSGYQLSVFSEITIEKKTFMQKTDIELVDGQTEFPLIKERFPIFMHDNSENIYWKYRGHIKLID